LSLDDIKTIAEIGKAPTIEQGLAQEIKAAYLKAFYSGYEYDATVDDVIIEKFYGTFNGCTAVLMDYVYWGHATVITMEIIEDITIYYSDSNTAYAYKDKQFYKIPKAYENGFLTIDDIKIIADIQNGLAIEPRLEQEIKTEFLKAFITPYEPDATVDDVIIEKFYGTFNTYTVVFFAREDADATSYDVVGGIIIHYPTFTNRALVYKDKHFYTLREAYENRFLLLAHIKIIADIQNKFITGG
jgi:hypothetical protein